MRRFSSPDASALSRQQAKSLRSSMYFARRFASTDALSSAFALFDFSVRSYCFRYPLVTWKPGSGSSIAAGDMSEIR